VLAELVVHTARRDAEPSRRLGLIPVRRAQRCLDDRALAIGERALEASPVARQKVCEIELAVSRGCGAVTDSTFPNLRGEIREPKRRVVLFVYECPANEVLDLSGVAGQAVLRERRNEVVADCPRASAAQMPILRNEMPDEDADVARTITQRWDVDRKDIEPVEQIGAEAPLSHHLLEIAIRRGDDADADEPFAVVAKAEDATVLQNTQ
jgi:hypothetical protein